MRLTNNLLHLSLREAFLDIVPYYIISSIGILLIDVFNIDRENTNVVVLALLNITDIFVYLFPLFLTICIAHHLANNYHVHRFIIIGVSLLVFISLAWTIDENQNFHYEKNMTLYALIIPIICMYSYLFLSKISFLQIIKEDLVSKQLKVVVNSIVPVLIIYIFFILILPYLSLFVQTTLFDLFHESVESLSLMAKSFIQLIVTHVVWWLTGIHGTHVYMIFADTSYLNEEIFKNLTADVFFFAFLVTGGAGATLSLLIAIILKSRNEYDRKIAYISFPFAIFNINEILLFGLPLIMNLTFVIPFLLVPIFNFAMSYMFFSYFPIPENTYTISWTTPVFLSGYFLGNGQTFVFILLQLINLVVGIFIYYPFLKKYEEDKSLNQDAKKLRDKFGIKEEVNTMNELKFLKTQAEIIQEQSDTHKMVDELILGDLLLYYQPKIDVKQNRCYGFEALLRFSKPDGTVTGPFFISQIEKAGFAYVIDLWVIKKVYEDLNRWSIQGFNPKISINLSPESISDTYIVNKIIKRLKGKNIEIEILERTFAEEHSAFMNNIMKLKRNGFVISVDDFGTGFSSLQYLHTLPANIIKLDKALLDNTKTLEGKTLYKNISKMCLDLNYILIAEGIETQEDKEFVQSVGVNIIQGFYFSQAIPFEKVKDYCNNF